MAFPSITENVTVASKPFFEEIFSQTETLTNVTRGRIGTLPPYNLDPTGTVTDTGKLQEALTAAHTAGGGTIYLPEGTFKKNYELVIPYNVRLVGAGRNATIIQDTTDLGASHSAARTEEESNSLSYPVVEHLSFKGPGSTTFSAGTQQAEMHGLLLKSDGEANRVNVYGYASGISFNGNHQAVEHCRLYGNYYGLYWRDGGENQGNQTVIDVVCARNNHSGVRVHKTNTIDSCTIIELHNFGNPYGMSKGNEAGTSRGFITDSTCTIYFEECGNGGIFDETGQTIKDNTFNNFAVSFNASNRIGGKAHEWTVTCGELIGNTFTGDLNGVEALEKGVFNCTKAYGNTFFTGETYLQEMREKRLIFADSNDVQGVTFYTQYGGRCQMYKVGGGAATPELGDLLYWASSLGMWGAAKTEGEGGSNIPVGFLMAWGLESSLNHWAPLLVEGPVKAKTHSEAAEVKALTHAEITAGIVKADTANRGKITSGGAEGLTVGYGKPSGSEHAEVHARLGG